MKNIYLAFCLLLTFSVCSGITASAQAQTSTSSDTVLTKTTIKDNTIFWQQDHLVQHKGGRLLKVQDPIQYENGTIVFADGRVRTPDGKTLVLEKKHAINPKGRIVLVADDLFTHDTIIKHERQTVGDTETRIVVIDGKIASVANNKEQQVYSTGLNEKAQLLEKMTELLEQRLKLLETALTPAEMRKIQGYYDGLNKQITIVEEEIKSLTSSVKNP
ncbi:DUF6799 domain-containing protein [Rufibacter roseus]|uniref:DUF6799 domain-containing protein n=1 Tax=Rufibacter roseus TaxID=1567108 RepID=A0ABW2DIN2_9BACT|nr:DUF6799 domain-containing protein [Rufibacter roseus]